MFKVRVFTLYPEVFPGSLGIGIYKRAEKKKIWSLQVIDIRKQALDKHKKVDDTPFGGGSGMVIKPDIISFGKKTQVCGMLAGDRILDVKDNVFKESSRINSTFGGNLVDMVRFKIILETIDKFSLLKNAQECGAFLFDKIEYNNTDTKSFK